jgi:hypothetical protein
MSTEGKLSGKGKLMMEGICLMEDMLEYNIPVVPLEDTQDAGCFIAAGLLGCPLFIVCKDEELAQVMKEHLNSYRERRKEQL